jgi:hypothetical protein
MKKTTPLHLVTRLRMVELHFHSSITSSWLGIELRPGITLRFLYPFSLCFFSWSFSVFLVNSVRFVFVELDFPI